MKLTINIVSLFDFSPTRWSR